MTDEIAQRLAPIFKGDFKKARFQAGCITMYPNLHGFKNEASKRKYIRKGILFEIAKELYVECITNLKSND